jgi:histone H3/H4
MKGPLFSFLSVKKTMQASSPGTIESKAIDYMREHLADYVRSITPYARKLAYSHGRKRITKEDIKLALEHPK